MESSTLAKDEESVSATAADVPAEVPSTDQQTDSSMKTEKTVLESVVTAVETNILTVNDEPMVSNDENAIATKLDTDNNSKNSVSIEDELIVSTTSLTISNTGTDDTDPIQRESVNLDKQQTQVMATTEKENVVIVNSTNLDLDISEKSSESELEKVDSKIVGELKNTCQEYVDKKHCAEKEQHRYINGQECSSDGKSSGEEGLVDDEEDGEEQGPESSVTVPTEPVPVDDDTNDPQYIPRRGRFYEHDDRMAYSTTSSEGTESESDYEENSEDDKEVSDHRRSRRRLHSGSKKRRTPATEVSTAEDTVEAVSDGIPDTKKVLEISKMASEVKDSSRSSISSTGRSGKLGFKKLKDVDSLDKWTHDMYDEHEQTRKSRDELLASYGYDIREESEAPRARRHHKYGRSATAKYTRNWQDTEAYSGSGGRQQSPKVKRGVIRWRSIGNSNKNKSATADEYSSEFPSLDLKNTSESIKSVAAVKSKAESSASDQNRQPLTPVHQQEKKAVTAIETGPSQRQETSSRASNNYANSSPDRTHLQDQKNGGHPSTSDNKNYFKRFTTDSSAGKEKVAQVSRGFPSPPANPNLFNRKQQYGGVHNQQSYKQHNRSQEHNQSSSLRGRNSRQIHNNQPQYNRDRYFSKGVAPHSSSNPNHHHYDHHHNAPTSAGTGRTQHGGGHYHHYNNRHYENEQIEPTPPPAPVVRSSKRYSVQSNRELPDPVLNFSVLTKAQQPQPPPVSQHQQQNGLVMQEQQQSTLQQMQAPLPPLQAPPPLQIHQQQPQPIQIQQYHQPLQQIHPHHGMVLDHNTGMMVMAADPSMYHHQLYAAPQYATAVAPGSTAVGTDDPNAVAAAAALQMLAQAAVYQSVPTGATGVTTPSTNAQQQQSETFMTTYYQPQQQQQQQPPPRRANLAIPIVAPPPEPNQQQSAPKTTSSSPTPAQTAT